MKQDIKQLVENGPGLNKEVSMMRNINEKFTDKEHEEIERVKKASGMNWHDFIIDMSKRYENNEGWHE